ncbi:MAG: carbonic anhydrase [Bacteroidia bacterium]|nr:carbonic anhydrase [Bacteroidia bacterium]
MKLSIQFFRQAGNLTQLLDQIKPAIATNGSPNEILQQTTRNNVLATIDDIKEQSEIVKGLIEKGQIKIVPAYYDLETGVVDFFEN